MKTESEIIEEAEKNHWWFIGRRKILAFFIKKYLRNSNPQILSIGCGPGVEVKFLENYGKVIGLDSSPEMLNFCKQKGINNIVLGEAENLPFSSNSFDVVAAFDVLEHAENDNRVIKEIHRVLKMGGIALITVPAVKWLYGDFDKFFGHWRRYNKNELKQELKGAGFSPIRISYFNTFLFLPIIIAREIKSILPPAVGLSTRELDCPPGWLNKILELILGSEKFLLSFTNFPFGISLTAIVSKK